MRSNMHMYPGNGATSRVSKKDTAWSFRDATWAMVIVCVDHDPENKEKITSWTKQFWEAL